MGRDRGPKNKLSRREGKDLFGTGGAQLERRMDQPPGAHGKQPQRNKTEYQRQLREKQKVKRMYGMRETQFERFFRTAQKTRGLTGLTLLQLLERRLDNVVYRLGFARTRLQSRQFVGHGHVLVDGKRVDVPSYLVEIGQTVTVTPALREIPDVKELEPSRVGVPTWLEVLPDGGKILRVPERSEIDQDINEQAIVEFYSR
ncbi:MAG TPA: 30S ribosomal protein S4 [Anaerolineaceae bacterium]|nr:30S ribosomal protein S4 [Anaerolineaceae bacterium]